MQDVGAQNRRVLGWGRWAWITAVMIAGIIGWERLFPVVTGEPDAAGWWPHMLLVDGLLALAVALPAVAGGVWLIRRRRWGGVGWPRLLRQAAVLAGLVTVVLVLVAPAHRAIDGRLWPEKSQPSLAQVREGASCLPSSSMPTSSRKCLLSDERLAKIRSGGVIHPGHHPERANYQGAHHATATGGQGWFARWLGDALAGPVVVLPLIFGALLLARDWPAVSRRLAGYGRRTRTRPFRRRSGWAAALVATGLVAGGSVVIRPASAEVPAPFSVPLSIPPVLTGSNINISMAETREQILPEGPATTMWTYNSSFPGPTIRRPSGQTTRVTFTNRLPVAAGDMSIHHHGNHSRSSEDGQPTTFLIPPGGQRTYTFEEIEDGRPERAVTQWYHDHRMGVTGRNVWNGLAGFYILDDPVDAGLPLPKGEFDVPLMVVDREFDENNQIPYEFNVIGGAAGNTILVNGRPQPFFNVGDRKYRFRILNASNSRPYTLALSNGGRLTQIATESGLIPRPVPRQTINLQPAERVEVVVDFAGQLGQNIVLQNLEGEGSAAEVMQFRVNRDLTDHSSVPANLRPTINFTNPVVTRNFTLGLDEENSVWTINGEAFDPNRVLAKPRLNTTERWTFRNDSPLTHVIHLHDVDWRLVDRNGGPPDISEAALKETFRIDPEETFSVLTRFTDHTGKFMFHCHILEHEDQAMMAQFDVQPR